jgi:hypothetical protein
MSEVPVIERELTKEEASSRWLTLTCNAKAYSERESKAYKMKMDAMKRKAGQTVKK